MSGRQWRVHKAQCKTCIEMRAEYGSENNGGDGRLVWVVSWKGGEFACRPTFPEAIEYATRKARAYARVS